MDNADRENLHSASISVRAIIELYKTAFGTKDPDRVKELYGQVLAFTVSHDDKMVRIYGHYAVMSCDTATTLEFYRHDLALFDFDVSGGIDRFKAYNFVRNVYEKFVPEHRERIKTAAAFLPKLAERAELSFAASDLALDETDSRQPSELASTSQTGSQTGQENTASRIREEKLQMEQQKLESQEREAKLEQQLKAQIDQLLQQMEQQTRESKEREEKLERQLKAQMEQQQEIVSLLRQPHV
ncbi:MAG: hypothetical protein M1826_007073 [Phylliscum demangeonii]|nr:MAG: hypothetical protein M1826_007073 [Phylliscum demangeonii]